MELCIGTGDQGVNGLFVTFAQSVSSSSSLVAEFVPVSIVVSQFAAGMRDDQLSQ